MSEKPQRITILHTKHEDPNPGRGHYVGATQDRRQFFVTTPFCWTGDPDTNGRDYVALYLWHEDGTFDSATVEQIAQRGEDSALPGNTLPPEAYQGGIEKMLDTLGELTYGDIVVAPFEKEIDGVTFGLVANPPDDEDDEWAVTAEPGNYMCWFAPWNGEYDT